MRTWRNKEDEGWMERVVFHCIFFGLIECHVSQFCVEV